MAGNETVIEVENVFKSFKLYSDKGFTLKEKILSKKRRQYDVNQVLNNVSFQIKRGETVGLIGENGCGKSTTLKLLSKIMYPDSGSVKVTGRVSSLIELGAGFHPDMSGRQNIFINASIFGLTRREIEKRLDAIIEFSELEDFIDNPVRTYSSGMYTRLAFSVAINVDANILLIDEILAVGDVNFQAKCFEKLREIKESGVTIVLVTHDSGTVDWFCDRAIWIEQGNIAKDGKASEVVDAYMRHMSQKKAAYLEAQNLKKEEGPVPEAIDDQERIGTRQAEITNAYFMDAKGQKITVPQTGAPLLVRIEYVIKEMQEYVFGIGILTLEGVRIFGTNTQLDHSMVPMKQGASFVEIMLDNFPLLQGAYILQVAITNQSGALIDFHRDYLHFNVAGVSNEVGLVAIAHKWR